MNPRAWILPPAWVVYAPADTLFGDLCRTDDDLACRAQCVLDTAYLATFARVPA